MTRRGAVFGRNAAKAAAVAHTDLNMFHAVITLMEGGAVSARANADAQRVIKLCLSAGDKCLRRYDAALERLADKKAEG